MTSVSGTPVARHAVDYKLNQTVATIAFGEEDRAAVNLSHNMPGFERFEVRFDPAGAWTASAPSFDWPLREASPNNHMQARAVNWAGACGPVAEIAVRRRRVATALERSAADAGDKGSLEQAPRPTAWPADAVAIVPITFRAGLYERSDTLAEATLPPEADAYEAFQLMEQTTHGDRPVSFALADGRIQFEVPGKTPIMGTRELILCLRSRSEPTGGPPAPAPLGTVPWKSVDPGWLDWYGALAEHNPVFQAPKGRSNVVVEVLAGTPTGDTEDRVQTLVIKNLTGERAVLLSEPFPIQPDVPSEMRFKARVAGGSTSSVKVRLRILSESRAEIGYVAPASAGALAAEWKSAVFFGVTPSEASFGQLRLDIDGGSAEISDVRVGPRAFPESGPATSTAGPLQFP